MDFLIKFNERKASSIRIEYCNDINLKLPEENVVYVKKLEHLDYKQITEALFTQYAFGDIIENANTINDLSLSKGLFYLLTLSNQNQNLRIEPDEFGFLPLFYLVDKEQFYISNSYLALVPYLTVKKPDPDFYVEVAILYSALNDTTVFKNIKKLKYGEVIELNDGLKIITKDRFYNNFVESPKSFNSSVNYISNTFIDISKFYVQDPCAISLTGGFDGRAITGCAHYHYSDFINFSYGLKGNGDVDNPIWIAEMLKLKYQFIELGEEYLASDYADNVAAYLKYSGGYNGFQYPQSLYAAKRISKERNIIVTGYLGSEVFSNAHDGDDEVTPQTVLDFLKFGFSFENFAYKLYPLLQNLNLVKDKSCITKTLERLSVYFLNLPAYLSLNQKFAVYCFENVYRHTFGIWIYNAMHYAKLRVPFMDKDFLKETCKTEVSQFYRRFLEKNPIKRIDGQLLYPNILKIVWPELNALNSSKGYSPKDILSLKGQFKIAYIKKFKINKFCEKNGLDKLSTIKGAATYLKNLDVDQHLIKNVINNEMNTNAVNRSLCFLALSKIETTKLLAP